MEFRFPQARRMAGWARSLALALALNQPLDVREMVLPCQP